MHQRIAMDQLDRGADPDGALARHREQVGAGHGQERPQALAAALHGIAHGFVQARLRPMHCWQHAIERRFDLLGDGCHARAQIDHRAAQARSVGSARARPSGPSEIFSTRSCASRSLPSQCSLSCVPRS